MTASNMKTCFVTVGATATFSGLIKAVLAADVRETLEKLGYDRLLVQYGRHGQEHYDACFKSMSSDENSNLIVEGFDLDKSGLSSHMRAAKGTADKQGIVISHAGICASSRVFCDELY
jgi:beta-1,4-N-acetylglucosaminyltransferase